MVIFGVPFSSFVAKAILFAVEKNQPYELRPMRPHADDPAFRCASPVGKIPAMVDGDLQLADSSAICHYLEKKIPMPELIPHNAAECGKTVWFDEYADTLISPLGITLAFNRFFGPKIFKVGGSEELAATTEHEKLPPVLAYLEGAIGNQDYLVGNRYTLADIAVTTALRPLRFANVAISRETYPNLAAYYDRLWQRASCQKLDQNIDDALVTMAA